MAQSLGTQTRNVNMNRFGHANRRLQFYKRSQLFLRVHNETFSVAMRVSNPDRSPIAIQGRDLRSDFPIKGCRCIWLIYFFAKCSSSVLPLLTSQCLPCMK